MTTDLQALWDTEDADQFRHALADQTRHIQAAQAELDAAALAWREASTRLRSCEDAVSEWTVCPEPVPTTLFLERLRALNAEVLKAEEEARRTKQVLNGTRQKRALLWDERRVKIRKKFEVLPLEEWGPRGARPTNGDTEKPGMAAEVQVETAKAPADQVSPLNGKKRRKKELPEPESILESEAEREEREQREYEEGKRRTLGARLDLVPLDQVPRMRPEYVAELAKRDLRTLGDVVTFISRRGQPLDLWLKETCHFRLSAAVDLLCCLTDWLEANPPPAPAHERRCSKCGCIENECAACYLRAGHACEWAGPLDGDRDICTVCVQESEEEVLTEAEPTGTQPALPGFETEVVKDGRKKRIRLKGEPITPLGVSQLDLKTAYIGALFAGGTAHGKPAQVKPVMVNGRPYVVWGSASGGDGATAWKLLPLYDPQQYVERFGPEAPGLSPAIFNRIDGYHGITVAVGRKQKYIIGPDSEGRTLVDQ